MNQRFRILFFLFILLSGAAYAKETCTDTINISNFKTGITLDNCWKYKTGDNSEWSSVDMDDNGWKLISENSEQEDSMLSKYKGIAWIRSSFYIDSALQGMSLALKMRTSGACDIFIDGKLVHSIGVVGKTEEEQVSGFSLRPHIIPAVINTNGWHQLAIRSSGFFISDNFGMIKVNQGFSATEIDLEIVSMKKALEDENNISVITIPVFFSGVFIVLSIFHFILFLYYRKNRSNLYYSLFTLLLFFIFFGTYLSVTGADLQTTKKIFAIGGWSIVFVPYLFIGLLYEVFYKRLLKLFWIFTGVLVLSIFLFLVFDNSDLGAVLIGLFMVASAVETIRVFIRAYVKKREGSRIFIFGMLFPVIGIIFISLSTLVLGSLGFEKTADKISEYETEFFLYSLLMSVSISMTIYLASDFSRMNRKLNEQIKEIKKLFNRTIEQEKERKQILENQNVELERMVVERTEEVVSQKAEIETKNRDIMDNLLYARRIQEAILPDIRFIYQTLKDSFIIYLPKDIVSGDFYSFSQRDEKVIIAAADCTGHGVTGAFMSMIGSSVLNQIVNERGITKPSLVLNNLNTGITEALKQSETDVNDGMDITLCTIDLKTLQLQYAGANRPLWIFRNGELIEIKSDKLAIGGFRIVKDASFTNHEMQLQKGDSIYLFTDGFADQFGGPNGKKLLSKQFREILASIQNLSMREQEKKLTDFFAKWKGDMIQVDDVLVIGIRV